MQQSGRGRAAGRHRQHARRFRRPAALAMPREPAQPRKRRARRAVRREFARPRALFALPEIPNFPVPVAQSPEESRHSFG